MAQILDKQPNCHVTHDEPPLLPWVVEPGAPGIRIVCLKRPREEVVAAFCRTLDEASPFPTNHRAREPRYTSRQSRSWARTASVGVRRTPELSVAPISVL